MERTPSFGIRDKRLDATTGNARDNYERRYKTTSHIESSRIQGVYEIDHFLRVENHCRRVAAEESSLRTNGIDPNLPGSAEKFDMIMDVA